MAGWDREVFTKNLIDDMRQHGGNVTTGPMAGRALLVLTTTGARSGQPRMAVLNFSRDGDAYVVAGTANGAPTDPSWIWNLKADPTAEVEAEGSRFAARAALADGSARDDLWDRHVAALPWFADYPQKTGRVIPMVRLTPAL